MNPRERQLNALTRKPTDRVSIDCICVENIQQIANQLKIPVDDVYDYLGIDGRIIAGGRYLGEKLENLDEWGSSALDDYSTFRCYPLSNGLSGYKPPNPDLYDYAAAAARAKLYAGKYAVRGPYWNTLFSRLCSLYGMEEALVKMMCEPVEFEQAVEMVFQYLYRFCENFLKALGDNLHILCLADDFASQNGMIFSPVLWRKFFKNRWKELFALGKTHGKHVWFHSCGNIIDVLPDLIDIGMDVWETVQLHTLPMSPHQLKKEYGKEIIFFGGVNTQRLPFQTPDEVAREVIGVIDVLYDGEEGLILGPDHHIKYNVSVENTVTLFLTAQNYKDII